MSVLTCPQRDLLGEYSLGRLSDEQSDQIAEHISNCDNCQQALQETVEPSDTLVAAIKSPVAPDPFLAEPERNETLALIRAIGREPSFVGQRHLPTSVELGDIGHYRLLTKLGEGGMGAVYKALHTKLDKVVALKVLPADRLQSPDAVSRFEREMKAVGKLSHPNIVAAHDAGEVDGKHYLVMEMVDGVDLSQLVRRVGPLSAADACELIRQAAVGLQHAHQRGMVHRDIKPSNLMLALSDPQSAASDSAIVKILDMGLALLDGGLIAAPRELTSTGQLMGTLGYMAPEQGSDSHQVDVRADIYSLGATLFKLLCGQSPFPSSKYNTAVKMLTALALETAPSIASRRDDLPSELVAIVDRMLAKRPSDRYATPSDVADALSRFAADADLAALLQAASVERSDSTHVDQSLVRTDDFLSRPSTGTEVTLGPNAKTLDKQLSDSARASEQVAPVLRLATDRKTALKPASALAHSPRSMRWWAQRRNQIIAIAIAGGLLFVSFGIWVIVRDKDGKVVAKVHVPEGGKAEIVADDGASKDGVAASEPHGSPTDASPVAADYALRFTGDEEEPDTSSAQVQTRGPWTVEGWITPREPMLQRGGQAALVLMVNPVWVSVSNGPGGVTWAAGGSTSRLSPTIYSSEKAVAGQRTHIALTRGPEGVSFFVNGVRQGEPLPIVFFEPVSRLRLCLPGEPSRRDVPYNGDIDEIRVSSVVRYPENFTPKSRFEPDADTVALYHVDEGEGEILHDASPNMHDAKMVNAKWVKVISDSIQLPSNSSPTQDQQRELVDWVFAHGGHVSVDVATDSSWHPNELKATDPFPDLPFNVIRVFLSQDSHVNDEDIAEFATRFPWVRLAYLQCSGVSITDRALVHIKHLFIGRLSLFGTSITDAGMTELRDMPQLINLSVDRTAVTDTGIERIVDAKLPLNYLGLSDTAVTKDGLANLAEMKTLEFIALNNIKLTAEGIGHLTKLPNLKTLQMVSASIDDDAFQLVTKIPTLEQIEAGINLISDKGLEQIGNLERLRILHLNSNKQLTDKAADYLSEVESLETLWLYYTPKLTDVGLDKLSRLKRLKELKIAKTGVTVNGVAKLKLALPNCQIESDLTDEQIAAAMAKMDVDRVIARWILSLAGSVTIEMGGELQEVTDSSKLPTKAFRLVVADLYNAGKAKALQVRDADLMQFQKLSYLTELHLSGTGVTDAGLVHLKDLKSLTFLSLNGTAVTDAGLAHLRGLENLADLRVISARVGDDGLAHLETLKNLHELHLSGTLVTNAGLARISKLQNLAHLTLNATRVTDDGLVHLKELKKLTALSLASTSVSDAGLLHLEGSKQLRELRLLNSQVTADGIAKLKLALPDCKIESD